MRFTSALAILAAAAIGLSACGVAPLVGSGDLVTRDFVVEDFDRIELGGAWEASISVGEDRSVTVRADDNLIEHVRVEVDDGRLEVKMDRSTMRSTTAISITVPSLRAFEVHGASAVSIDGLDEDELKAEFGGASTTVLNGDVDDLKVEANGAITLVATGRSNTVELEANGASTLEMSEWATKFADIDLNGATEAVLTGAEAISGETNGASTLVVAAESVINVDTSGASDIERR